MAEILMKGTDSIWWAYIDRLSDKSIYPKEYNVVPFVDDSPKATNRLIFVDYLPDLYDPLSDVYLRIFINQREITPSTGAMIQDAFGLLYCEFQLERTGEFVVTIKSLDLTIIYRTYTFNAKNLYLLSEMYGVEFSQIQQDQEKVRNDTVWSLVRDEKMGQNFARLMDVDKPPIFTTDQFRLMLLGSDLEPGLRRAFLRAGSMRGVKDAVRAITGVDPVITDFKSVDGFVTYDKDPGPLPDDPTALPEYYSFNPPELSPVQIQTDLPLYDTISGDVVSIEDQVIVTYDGRFLDFSFILLSKNSIRNVIQESVIRKPISITSTDVLINRNIIPHNGVDFVVINQGATIYTEGADFTVDRDAGTITWGIGFAPADKSIYNVDYKFYLKDIIIPMVERIKPAVCNIIYEFE